jgi:UDP-hydrolysing UDP-N-acetyl-D-glucosamine 2-epimerase
MAARRTICVVTGTRAEYGLLRPLMRRIADDADLCLQVIVTGTHLSPHYGLTREEIVRDGFAIDAQVEMLLASDTSAAVVKSMALAMIGLADALERLGPDLVVVLGDRYEMLAVAQTALLMRIPVAHVSGGEVTEGAIDDCMRHAISKMSALHFVATDVYRRRIIQLGEAPDFVHTVGAMGAEAVRSLVPVSREELEQTLGMALTDPVFLVTYHPETACDRDQEAAIGQMAAALDAFPQARIVITGVNADPGNIAISRALECFASSRRDRVRLVSSLGQLRYLSLMRIAAAVIGNSSSGVVEAPVVGVPTVNIGDRQRGRYRARSVVDCAPDVSAITAAIHRVLSDEFRRQACEGTSELGDGNASERIVAVLKAVDLGQLSQKRFHDL